MKNLDCFFYIWSLTISATEEIKISDPSQSLVPTEEAPLRRFAHLNGKFYNQLGPVTFISSAGQAYHYVLVWVHGFGELHGTKDGMR